MKAITEETFSDARGRYVYGRVRKIVTERKVRKAWDKVVKDISWDAFLVDKKTNCIVKYMGNFEKKKEAVGSMRRFLII